MTALLSNALSRVHNAHSDHPNLSASWIPLNDAITQYTFYYTLTYRGHSW